MRRATPFELLGIHFGIVSGTASNYYHELLDCFVESLVPLLMYPLTADEVDSVTPEDFKEDLPGCKVIFDLTGFAKKSKENVLLSRVLHSAYHNRSEAGVVFGESFDCFPPFFFD